MRRFAGFAVKALISATLLYFAVGRGNFAGIAERLNHIRGAWLAAGLALACGQLVFLSLRWRTIADHCGARLAIRDALRWTLIATFFNQILPSTVGGDAARVWLLARDGAGWTLAAYSVMLDRFVGVLALALVVLAGLPWGLRLIADPVGRTALLAIGVGSIAASAAFVALADLKWVWPQRWWPVRHLMQMAATARRMLTAPVAVAAVVGLSLAIHLMTIATAWCAARAVGAPLGFMSALLLVPPVLLIATIPVSIAGWGVRESALMLGFSYAGLPPNDGLIVSMLLGAMMLVPGLAGGAVWLTTRRPLQPAPPPLQPGESYERR